MVNTIPVCVTMIVLNEADYIFQSLQSIYSSVDKIVIVEGATKYAVKDVVSPMGLSTDGTAQLIQVFQDTLDIEGKIKYVRAGWAEDKAVLRNRCLEHVPKDTYAILIVDGDELFKAEDIRAAVQAMQLVDALVVKARHFMFWGSTDRLLESVPDLDYTGRLLRYFPTMHYKHHQGIYLDASTSYYDDPSRIICPEGFDLYHYGYVRDVRKLVLKRWERLRQIQADSQHIPEYRYLQAKDDYRLYLEAISHFKAFNLANIDMSHESIMPFTGTHPGSMLRHPFFKQPPQFFGFD